MASDEAIDVHVVARSIERPRLLPAYDAEEQRD